MDTEENIFSCTPAEQAIQILALPRDVSGLTILDLAAGGSSLTPFLLAQGANAHAVDVEYDRSSEFLYQKGHELLLSMAALSPSYFYHKMVSTGENTLNEFTHAYRGQRQRFHHGDLTHLPFPNDYAHLVVSLNGLLSLGGNDAKLLETMLDETLRVAKKGARIILSPFHSYHSPDFDFFAQGHASLLTTLERRKISWIVESSYVQAEIPLPSFDRLEITKP